MPTSKTLPNIHCQMHSYRNSPPSWAFFRSWRIVRLGLPSLTMPMTTCRRCWCPWAFHDSPVRWRSTMTSRWHTRIRRCEGPWQRCIICPKRTSGSIRTGSISMNGWRRWKRCTKRRRVSPSISMNRRFWYSPSSMVYPVFWRSRMG